MFGKSILSSTLMLGAFCKVILKISSTCVFLGVKVFHTDSFVFIDRLSLYLDSVKYECMGFVSFIVNRNKKAQGRVIPVLIVQESIMATMAHTII